MNKKISDSSSAYEAHVVRVEQGFLKGVWCSNSEGSYWAFKGIPYAKPPVGDLRFRPPEPPESWEGIRDATEHGEVCPQFNDRMNRLDCGSEDCLYLNVYTPTLTPKQPLPVMFWIHGGGFYTGSGNSDIYGPEFFITQNVILVTINYRLEVLGFLCLDLEEAPGNAGLKDQVAALKWVKSNIAGFGGDHNNVTIFGCSAGAASVSYHLVSNMSKGLFHKAICQSGVCLNDWAYTLYPKQRAIQLGNILGANTEEPVELLKFLKSVHSCDLMNIKLPPLDVPFADLSDEVIFGPVLENSSLKTEPFITISPPDLLNGDYYLADVPLILGFTSGDGIELTKYFTSQTEFTKEYALIIPRELKFKLPLTEYKDIGMKMLDLYFRDASKSVSTEEIVGLFGDTFFVTNIRRFAKFASTKNFSPVYVYCFCAETGRGLMKSRYGMQMVKGVCHADELYYQFNLTALSLPLSEESRQVIKRFVRLWTDFARTGHPTPSPDLEKWKRFVYPGQENCYMIDKECRNQEGVQKFAMFWDKVYGDNFMDLNLPHNVCSIV